MVYYATTGGCKRMRQLKRTELLRTQGRFTFPILERADPFVLKRFVKFIESFRQRVYLVEAFRRNPARTTR